jgi:hypothetical protein
VASAPVSVGRFGQVARQVNRKEEPVVISTRMLTLIVVLAALLASALTYTVTSFAQPSAATASDKQIVNAIRNVIGTSEFDGNSLRNDLRKMIGTNKFQGLRGDVHNLCRALAENPLDC